ncbi:hypothetical protein [Candidatus Amarolinea dominans]|uniref:hypothetical protein n=1 Tax=Candidatus Amarolinea dominans TaxID=3140696 RepID=UPI001DC678F8|nr:hypothetical protein [Anaerolineae bacterium]
MPTLPTPGQGAGDIPQHPPKGGQQSAHGVGDRQQAQQAAGQQQRCGAPATLAQPPARQQCHERQTAQRVALRRPAGRVDGRGQQQRQQNGQERQQPAAARAQVAKQPDEESVHDQTSSTTSRLMTRPVARVRRSVRVRR